MTDVAVVILNYNGEKLLKKFLPSVLAHSTNARVIVADNNSSDQSISILSEEFPQVEVIPISSNLGFCGGYNYALSRVQAKYFVLLNSDVEVTPNWIQPVISLFEGDAAIGAVQPKILSYANKDMFEYAGAGGGWIDLLGYPFCRGRLFHSIEKDSHQYDDAVPVFWATGACLFVRADLFQKMGGLDEDYFAHMEEIDLCWKLNRAGYRVFYQGASRVYHVGGGTLATSNPRKTYLNFRNGLSILFKHNALQQLAWKLPARIALDWAAALKFLLEGSGASAVSVLKAHVNFLLSLKDEVRKRNQLKSQHSGFKVNNVYQGFITFDFFVKGRRSFLELDKVKLGNQ